MGENNKVLLGVLGGVLLGAFGAAVVKRGNLMPPKSFRTDTTLRMQSLSRLKRSKKHVKI
jgi:hypothetical protein